MTGEPIFPNQNADTGTILAAANQGAATLVSVDQINTIWRGLKLYINVTQTGTLSLVVTIQGKDPISGVYYTILASAAIVATGLAVLTVFPGATASANVAVSDILPHTWRVQAAVAGGAPNASFTIGASLAS